MPNPYAPAARRTRLPRPADEPADRTGVVVAHVHKYPPVHNAGAEWYLHELLLRLAADGHEARVLADVPSSYRYDGVRVDPANFSRAVYRDADVVVTHLDYSRLALRNAAARGLPLVHLVHNDRQLTHHRIAAGEASLVLSNSEWVRAATPDRLAAVASDVVRPHVPVGRYRVDDPPPADREFVTLLNCSPAKGVRLFYEVARRRPDLRFLAVRGAYGQQIPPPADLDNVVAADNTPNVRAEVYARTRVLFVPSSYESWGRVAVEAMASGIPVLASSTPGLREACGDAAYFLSVDLYDSPTLWADVLGWLDDPALYAEASRRAAARAVELEAVTAGDLDRAAVWVRRLLR